MLSCYVEGRMGGSPQIFPLLFTLFLICPSSALSVPLWLFPILVFSFSPLFTLNPLLFSSNGFSSFGFPLFSLFTELCIGGSRRSAA